jgi:hypothetical protein
MSNQIVISSGAKVRNLDGVLTGTSGIVNSVPLGAANGVATLDSGGKVPVSQLPSSVVTYLGTWNAATNTPTLVNGTGDAGDMYICNVAGTVNFGAGPVTFAVGDWVLYGSGTWQKSNGQNGTVTSVGVSRDGDALSITGSPITTSGTINIGFAGTSGQYINGAGNLTTFPSLTGFVPYTGATQSVNLGIWDLDAANLFSNGLGVYIKKNASGLANAVGYVALSSTTYKLGIAEASSGLTGKSFNFDFAGLTDNATRNYTLPDLSGTLALLEGTQTFSGSKTFSALTAFTFTNGTRMDYGLYLSKGSIPSAFSSSTTNIYSDATTNNIVIRDNSSNAKLVFNNSTQTYTFPAATGTIALTSDIPSLTGYVPYTGATGAVNLGAFDLTVNGLTVGKGGGSISTNTVLGTTALSSNTTGASNVAIGINSLNTNTTGGSNVAVGQSSLQTNNGNQNTAIGNQAMQFNTTGSQNTALGSASLQQNTTGIGNTSIGYASLSVNTSGNYNVSLGGGNGNAITTGSSNILIGYNTGNGITTGSNNTITVRTSSSPIINPVSAIAR